MSFIGLGLGIAWINSITRLIEPAPSRGSNTKSYHLIFMLPFTDESWKNPAHSAAVVTQERDSLRANPVLRRGEGTKPSTACCNLHHRTNVHCPHLHTASTNLAPPPQILACTSPKALLPSSTASRWPTSSWSVLLHAHPPALTDPSQPLYPPASIQTFEAAPDVPRPTNKEEAATHVRSIYSTSPLLPPQMPSSRPPTRPQSTAASSTPTPRTSTSTSPGSPASTTTKPPSTAPRSSSRRSPKTRAGAPWRRARASRRRTARLRRCTRRHTRWCGGTASARYQ